MRRRTRIIVPIMLAVGLAAPPAAADTPDTWVSIISDYIGLTQSLSTTVDGFSSTGPTPQQQLTSAPAATGAAAVGTTVRIGGMTGTVCKQLNAYGLTTIVAGPSTSCPFAIDTVIKSMTGANPRADVHFSSDRTLSVRSKVTGKTYAMSCTEHDTTIFECTDTRGGTARVWAY